MYIKWHLMAFVCFVVVLRLTNYFLQHVSWRLVAPAALITTDHAGRPDARDTVQWSHHQWPHSSTTWLIASNEETPYNKQKRTKPEQLHKYHEIGSVIFEIIMPRQYYTCKYHHHHHHHHHHHNDQHHQHQHHQTTSLSRRRQTIGSISGEPFLSRW